jgi:hypothetical protein
MFVYLMIVVRLFRCFVTELARTGRECARVAVGVSVSHIQRLGRRSHNNTFVGLLCSIRYRLNALEDIDQVCAMLDRWSHVRKLYLSIACILFVDVLVR